MTESRYRFNGQKYLHMRAQRCFYNLRQNSVVSINIMKTDLDVAASNLRNGQWMYQNCRPPAEIHEYKKKNLHLDNPKSSNNMRKGTIINYNNSKKKSFLVSANKHLEKAAVLKPSEQAHLLSCHNVQNSEKSHFLMLGK